ncbi:hypothetical protein ABZY45_14330 [Streptomyces sp. NPDC006516]|uniref:hypothetical protein n=1 Tax=Streptomyces sp. NPDC006516 TaxID=3154309 RepID=UPI0033A8B878
MASVYAEFAWRQGWLKPDRVLDAETYASMRSVISPWAQHNRVWADVLAAFGPPSVLFGGTNPLYGKTLGYVAKDIAEPMISFHLWNGTEPGSDSTWPRIGKPRFFSRSAVVMARSPIDSRSHRKVSAGARRSLDTSDARTQVQAASVLRSMAASQFLSR